MAEEHGPVSAAKVAILNIEAIKTVLGNRWEKLEPLVGAFFEAAIQSSFKPGDAYFKTGDLGYIVIYRDLSIEQMQAKCADLSRDVSRRLFGEEGIEVAVRNVVGPIDRGLLKAYQHMAMAIDRSLELHGDETVVFASEDISADAAATRLEFNFTQHQERRFHCSESNLSFAYRPIWDCSSRVILTYLCQPIPPGGVDSAVLRTTGFGSVSTGDADCALLDRTILAHCVKRIEKLHHDSVHLMLGVPLHFSTLSRARPWGMFNDVYRHIPPDILREIVFVVFGLDGVPNNELVQQLGKLSNARHLFCVTEPDNTVAGRFADVRAHAVGMEFPRTHEREKSVLDSVKSLAGDARANGHKSFVLGVTNTSRAVNAMAAGVRYLEGPAIHPVVADPRCVLMHDLEDLYVSKTG